MRERSQATREWVTDWRSRWYVGVTSVSLALLMPVLLSAQTVDPQGLAPSVPATGSTRAVPTDPRSIQQRVNVLLTRLSIPESVQVDVVSGDSRIASVVPVDEDCRIFRLVLDASFMESLSEDELTASLAHELGHVWVFTHHPYLQTERLANEIALRLVTRDSLARLYAKLWQWQGAKGDLVRVLGD